MSDQDFDRLSESELQKLSSDGLIRYIRKAAAAGRPDWAQSALSILCYRHLDDIQRRVALRVPPGDVEDVAMTVIVAAIESAFSGSTIAEFRSWLNTIIKRRGIADFHKKREGKPRDAPLPTEHQGDEEIWGEEPSEEDETGAVAVQEVIDTCLDELSEAHRQVVELNVFDDLDAVDAAERVNEDHPQLSSPMSTANVHQIKRRFKERVRAELEAADSDPS